MEIGKRFVYEGVRYEVVQVYPSKPHLMAAISVKRCYGQQFDGKPTRLIYVDQDFLQNAREDWTVVEDGNFALPPITNLPKP